jgi:tetratricopeptide (TPR) repeat protein
VTPDVPSDQPAPDSPEPTRRFPRERDGPAHPERIGPYRILRMLGEGGMGTVYEAEQTETIQRRVALKLVKLGMDTREVVARFEAERQALGVMDHPAIARVLDGGATDDGRPYFVMELVHGVPLTAYCDRNALSMRRRLELFVELCHAVAHAHAKGVIHRDLKPSNVLVVEHDGKAMPKVIDFGVAKAVGPRLGEQGFVTELGHAIGTPAYMSPEQAEASTLDVDTRSDVYSLGVMLYELLVGALPVDWEKVGAQTYLARLARHETNPPTPSARLTGLGEKQAEVARQRRTSAASLRKELKGDLDWVVMKALEPERARRYETVSALGADLQRYLAGEPVLARAPSMAYAARKLVRRHRVAVAAASAVLLAVVLGLVGTTHGLLAARRERAAAQREAKTATRALDFLVGMFEEADPMALPGEGVASAPGEKPRGETLTAKEVLERGAKRLETELKDEPIARARLLGALGEVNLDLQLLDAAEPHLREAFAIMRTGLGADHFHVAHAYRNLGRMLLARGDYVGARAASTQALQALRARHGPEDREVALTLIQLAQSSRYLGDFQAAKARAVEGLTLFRRVPDHTPSDLAHCLHVLAELLVSQGDVTTALPLLREELELQRRTAGPRHPYVARCLVTTANALKAQGDLAAARTMLEEALAIRRESLGPDHTEVATSLSDLGRVLREQGDFTAARSHYEEALAIDRRTLGPDHPEVAADLANLGACLGYQGDRAGARALLEEALEIQREAFGPEGTNLGPILTSLGGLYMDDGDPAAAAQLYEQAVRIKRRTLSPTSANLAVTLSALAYARARLRDLSGARALYEEALAIQRVALPPQDPALAGTLLGLGFVLVDVGDLEGAEGLLRESLSIAEQAPRTPRNDRLTAEARDALVRTLDRMGRSAEASALTTMPPHGGEKTTP